MSASNRTSVGEMLVGSRGSEAVPGEMRDAIYYALASIKVIGESYPGASQIGRVRQSAALRA